METINNLYHNLFTFLTGSIPKAMLLMIFGYFIARFISAGVIKITHSRLSINQAFLIKRIIFYAILILFLTSAFQELGFRLSVLLGATGLLTVAVGIASQTSMSNVVSGIFIIGEKPFQIGNVIQVNNMQGEVMSIDFLSVKIRTDDNTMIRIPNETLIKSPITNLSYFATRRYDFKIKIAYKEDLKKLKKMLLEIAYNNSLSLKQPKPAFSVVSLNSGIEVQLSVWSTREDFTKLKSLIQEEIKNAIVEAEIEFPVNYLFEQKLLEAK